MVDFWIFFKKIIALTVPKSFSWLKKNWNSTIEYQCFSSGIFETNCFCNTSDFFQKQFKKAFCPRIEIPNLQKHHTLKSNVVKLSALYIGEKLTFFENLLRKPRILIFIFVPQKHPACNIFTFSPTFFFKISPTSHTHAFPPTFSIGVSPLIIHFSPSYGETFLILWPSFQKN